MGRARILFITALVALVAALTVIVLEGVSTFELINLRGRDIFFRLQHDLFPIPLSSDDVVLVTVDDQTLMRIPTRWPYPRSYYAQALDNMRPYAPKVVGFDLVFSGNDYLPESDAVFAKALKDSGNVVIASYQSQEGQMAPPDAIRDSVWRMGVVDKIRDADRVVRHANLSRHVGNQVYRAWELEIFEKVYGALASRDFPLKAVIPINFRLRFNEFKQIPFWKLAEGKFSPGDLQNKTVLLGLTGEVFHDVHATPLGSMPGLAVNANTLLMLMNRDFFTYVSVGSRALLTFLSFWLVILVSLTASATLGFFVVLLLAIILISASFFVFVNQTIIDVWLVVAGMAAVYIASIVYRQGQLFLENMRLQEESARDPLTGFYSRRFLELKLKSELGHMLQRGGAKKVKEVSVVMIDLDNFKLVNDTFGHGEGDRVLRTMAAAIRGSVRKDELICRFGGDEFCVILSNTSMEDAAKFAEKLRTLIVQNPDLVYRTQGGVDTIRVTGSIGVASVTGAKASDPDKLMKAADRALYRAKAGGRNQVCIFDPKRDVIE